MVEIQRPPGVNVGVNNPGKSVYIGNINAGSSANDTTDGSIRLQFDVGDSEAHVALRADGVWNDTGFRFASSSVALGRDLKMGAVGGYVETLNLSEIDQHIRALLPHMQFSGLGSIMPAHMPVLDVRQDFVVFAGPATGETIATTIGQVFAVVPSRILHSTTHTTGTVAATAPIQISYYKGTDNTGSLISRFNIPTATMPAGTTFTTVFDDDFGFENAQSIFVEFFSVNNISLVTNASGEVITTQNGHVQAELDIVLQELILDNDLSLCFDNNLDLAIHNRFP